MHVNYTIINLLLRRVKVLYSYGSDVSAVLQWTAQSLFQSMTVNNAKTTRDNLHLALQTDLYGTMANPYRDAGKRQVLMFHLN